MTKSNYALKQVPEAQYLTEDQVNSLIKKYTHTDYDAFQAVWVALLEDHAPLTETIVIQYTRSILKRLISTKYTKPLPLSLSSPIHPSEARTLSDIYPSISDASSSWPSMNNHLPCRYCGNHNTKFDHHRYGSRRITSTYRCLSCNRTFNPDVLFMQKTPIQLAGHVILLRAHGMTIKRIAEITHLSDGTIFNLLHNDILLQELSKIAPKAIRIIHFLYKPSMSRKSIKEHSKENTHEKKRSS
ncbi:MAG: hypothetical protein WC516_08710 [Patescibacteria group bacterium]|jgi:transposase-like protein